MQRTLRRIGVGAAILIVAATLFGYWTTDGLAALGGTPDGTRRLQMQESPQYDPEAETFTNAIETTSADPAAAFDILVEWLFGSQERVPPGPMPVVALETEAFATPPASGLRITWLGHSTTLIEIDGVTVLADPVFSERSSPSRHIGPRRFHPPPIRIQHLPQLDAVLISHDHYDHLDYASIRTLRDQVSRFIVPLGVGAHLTAWGVPEENITELDWWDVIEIGSLRVTATPARHFSGRSLFDANVTLWTSYTLAGPHHNVFFSGDTGMHEQFAEIAERLGPFDVVMLEVGQYNVHWMDVHLFPEQAIQASQILGGRILMPIHWGTFELAFHDWDEPPRRLSELARRNGVTLFVPRPGESFEPERLSDSTRWWEQVGAEEEEPADPDEFSDP